MSDPAIQIFGVRHHGPGSARSVLRALEQVRPQCLLIEGPPDADEMIPFVAREELKPPVAILVHDVESPRDAVYFPFAEFSPEWQAIRWALASNVPVRFMDLPQSHRLAMARARREAPAVSEEIAPAEASEVAASSRDPLGRLANAAGFDDGERWWEHVVEHNRGGDLELFAVIRDAMMELRQSPQGILNSEEAAREAWMRRTIRQASREFQRIAVVCGAWHAPSLDMDAFKKKDEDAILSALPKVKTAATWVPWTHTHLTFTSGYGAGIHSPGWYEHLWRCDGPIIESWMTRVAHLLRDRDIDCSSAHVIEAVRLSTSLAVMRGRPLADLSDIADATRSVFCFDSDLPMRLIGSELLVGDRLGTLPDDVPMVPLAQDLSRLQKKLRLKPEAAEKPLDLDLRNDTDRQRSHLLHRLRLLGIDWGTPDAHGGGKGTFHELWKLRWEPGFAVELIQAGVLGTTIEEAAAGKLTELAKESNDLKQLTHYLNDAILAELGEATNALVRQIEAAAAVAADVTLLMETLPELARLLRYGNVRQTDAAIVGEIVNGIVPRITVGLGGAVASLNDDAAAEMQQRLRETHAAIELLNDASHRADWLEALQRVLNQTTVHGLILGRSARLLFDSGKLSAEELATKLSLTLSRGNDPAQAARWLEGFISGSGLLLIHDPKLLSLIDAWVGEIDPAIFQELVPLLRRTFTTFPAPERRQIGSLLKGGAGSGNVAAADADLDIDPRRAERALSLLQMILAPQGAKPSGPS